MTPPHVDILDEDMHYCIFGPLLNVVALEQERVRSKAEFGQSLPERICLETNCLVEAQTRLEFFRGKEGAKRTNLGDQGGDVVHRRLLSTGSV